MEDQREIKDKGLAMFLVNKKFQEEKLYFYDQIPSRYIKHRNISQSILKMRNILLWLTFCEIFASIWGFSYYFIRRVSLLIQSNIYIAVNTAAFLISIIGVLSVMFIFELGLILYTLV